MVNSVFIIGNGRLLLTRSAILIVEDEPIVGMALSSAVKFAGGDVVGPAATVEAALKLLDWHQIAGAILDVNLSDGVVSPLVYCLKKRRIPLIVQTGIGLPADLAALFPDLIVKMKPNFSQPLVSELLAMIANSLPADPPARLVPCA